MLVSFAICSSALAITLAISYIKTKPFKITIMKPEDRFEKIWIDLREFGWGIREVPVIWPEDHEGGDIKPGVPIPHDTVDSDSIIDDSIMEEDLNDSVKDRMTITHDSSTGGLRLGGYAQAGNVPVSTGGSGGFNDEMQEEEGD